MPDGTVIVVVALAPPKLAVTMLLPAARPVTRPPLATPAVAGVAETKALLEVTSRVVVSD
jgi:hypothetical protein